MNGISPAKIPILIAKDVELIRKKAKFVIDLSMDDFRENKDFLLDVLAVIGPGEFEGQKYQETLLLEIGLGKSRPYHEASGRNGNNHWISYRRKWFNISPEQYCYVAPIIFSTLQKLTDERVCLWKHGPYSSDPFLVPTERNYYSRHQKKLFNSVSYKPAVRGARFAASIEDTFLLGDIFWAELNLNYALKKRMRGLMRFIDFFLNQHKNGFRRDFEKLKRVKLIKHRRLLTRLPDYLKVEMLTKYLRHGKKNPLWPYYVDLFGWDGQTTKECHLASLALPELKNRLGEIQLRITTDLNGRNSHGRRTGKKDHIVFEILPSEDLQIAGKEAEYDMPNNVNPSADECLLAV